jgi:hypothetical protein
VTALTRPDTDVALATFDANRNLTTMTDAPGERSTKGGGLSTP